MSRPSQPGLDLAATAGLVVFGGVVAAGFARVFSGWDFLPDLLLIVVVGHIAGAVLRHLGLRAIVALPAHALVLAWLVAALHYRSTFNGPFPVGATWDLFSFDVGIVREQFRTAVAPVIYATGWASLTSIGIATAVFLADAFAFRAEARGEALVPGGVLFVFVAALGYDRQRLALTVALVAAGVVAVALLRLLHGSKSSPASAVRRRVRFAIPGMIGFAVAAALIAGFVGPRVPGAEADALYDTRNRGGGVIEVISPLVDIRSRLVNQSGLEMFRIEADRPAYWRGIALPTFDGRRWVVADGALTDADGDLAAARPSAVRINQRITINRLGGKLVPAAADPIAVVSGGGLRIESETSTLVVGDDLESGQVFEITSALPSYTPDELRAAGSANPPDGIYLELPDNVPDEARRLADDLTASAATSYDAVRALQDWFQREFDYSLEVQRGHSSNDIENFLRLKVGYCEQFAGTFAVMARSLGIPARVAVGFTQGREVSPGVFSVTGRNAHAWPEVWFDGIGWVSFEPTPGRGAPGNEAWTGVAPAQDTSTGSPAGTNQGSEGPPQTALPRLPSDPDAATTIPDLGDFGQAPGGSSSATSSPDEGSSTGWWVFIGILAAAGAGLAAPWVSRQVRRRRMRPEDQLARLWERARSAVRAGGMTFRSSMTPLEIASITSTQLPICHRPMRSLASTMTSMIYAPPGTVDLGAGAYGASTLTDCKAWCEQVEQSVDDALGLPVKLKRHLTTWR
jgi:transglutaminase-like putative cysteine protease